MTDPKDPTTYTLLTWLWVMVLSIWGGLINYMHRVKTGEARAFNFIELIGEITVAGFVGILTFLLCEAANINQLISAALVGISAHMGSRMLFLFERTFEAWLRQTLCRWFPRLAEDIFSDNPKRREDD